MASLKFKIFSLLLLFHAMFLLSSASLIRCGDEEDNLLGNINAYRTLYLGLPALTENKRATCLANKIVDTLSDPCNADEDPVAMAELNDYPEQLQNCLQVNHTRDGVILLICVPNNGEDAFQDFYNYTRRKFEKYVNDSSYSGAGVGFNENWMVFVLNKNNGSWISSGAKNILVSKVGFGHCLVTLLTGMFFYPVL